MSSCRTLISGSCSASCASATRSRARSSGSRGDDDRLQRRRRRTDGCRSRRLPVSPIRSPIWTSARPQSFADCARARPPDAARRARARRRRSPSPCRSRPSAEAAAGRAFESSPRTSGRTRSSRRSAPRSILKTVPDDRPVGIAAGGRQQLGDAGRQRLDARTRHRGAEEDGVHECPRRLGRELLAQQAVADTCVSSSTYAARIPSSRSASSSARPAANSRVAGSSTVKHAARVPSSSRCPWRRPRRQPLGDLPQHTLGARLRAGRSCSRTAASECAAAAARASGCASAAARPRRPRCTSTAPSSTLRTRSTSAMKSGWPGVSIRLTCDVPDRERRDGGPDRDPAPPLERQRVGLRRAGIDAAELVDDARVVQQPFGESCLTGVYVRQDPQG